MIELLAILLILTIAGFAAGFGAGVGREVYEKYGLFSPRPKPEIVPCRVQAAPDPVVPDEHDRLAEEEQRGRLIEVLAMIAIAAARSGIDRHDLGACEVDAAACDRAVDAILGKPDLLLKEHARLWREVTFEIVSRRNAMEPSPE